MSNVIDLTSCISMYTTHYEKYCERDPKNIVGWHEVKVYRSKWEPSLVVSPNQYLKYGGNLILMFQYCPQMSLIKVHISI